MQVPNFSKIRSKTFQTYFLKISLHFLVEDGKPYHLICELFSTVNNEEGVGFLLVLLTNGGTDLRFFEIASSH